MLSLESSGFPLLDTDLVDICSRLLRLRYLGIQGTPFIRALPPQIGRLQNLEALDVSNTYVEELPWLFPRSASSSVLVGRANEALLFKFSADGVLAVMGPWNKGTGGATISSWQVNPTAGEENLSIVLYDDDNLGFLCQPPAFRGLRVGRRHIRVPVRIKQDFACVPCLDIRLCKLEDDDHDFLGYEMSNLQRLTLRLEVLPRKPIVIEGGWFLTLKSFCLDCRLPMVTFQQGAMPALEHLEFKFYTSRALESEEPMGISNLRSLQKVAFRSSSRYSSDAPGISAVINKVREEAKEHPNKITISINGKDEEVTRERKKGKAMDTTTTPASSDSTISDGNMIVTDNNGRAGGTLSGASTIIQTRLRLPGNDDTDDEDGGIRNIVPAKSYYPFGVME